MRTTATTVRAAVGLGLGALLILGCAKKPQEPTTGSAGSSPSAPGAPHAASSVPRTGGAHFSGAEARVLLARFVLHQRWYGAPERAKAIEFLRSELAAGTMDVELQEVSVVEPLSGQRYTLTNLVGHQNPRATARHLLGSHWDGRLWAEEDPDPAVRDRPAQYANDGGSGVAVLLALARRTAALRNVGIDYVLFDGEEFGRPGSNDYCQGARYYARELERTGAPRPRDAVVLDMVGDADLDIFYEVTSLRQAPALTREIWHLAAELGIEAFHPTPKYTIVDDHSPLQTLGIPAVLLIDYDYPYWHTRADTMDKVSEESLESVGRLMLELVLRWDAAAALAP
jgi:glutaminyl-peptide cyclotransferase